MIFFLYILFTLFLFDFEQTVTLKYKIYNDQDPEPKQLEDKVVGVKVFDPSKSSLEERKGSTDTTMLFETKSGTKYSLNLHSVLTNQ